MAERTGVLDGDCNPAHVKKSKELDDNNQAKQELIELYEEVRKSFPRGVGGRKIAKLINASKDSIGIKQGSKMATKELDYLLKRYSDIISNIGNIEVTINGLCEELPESERE